MPELSDTEPESGDSDEEFFVPPGSPQPVAGEAASKTDRVTCRGPTSETVERHWRHHEGKTPSRVQAQPTVQPRQPAVGLGQTAQLGQDLRKSAEMADKKYICY